MADIFISYAHEDRDRVESLARALEASGLSVWWDRHLEAGTEFSKHIEEELTKASAVLVIWSSAGVNSTWVKDEASLALEQQKLVPVQLDATLPPLGFRQFQTISLATWKGRPEEAVFTELLALLGRRMERTLEPTPAEGPGRRLNLTLYGAIGAAVVLLALVLGIFIWMPGSKPPGEDIVAEGASSQVTKSEIALAVIPFVNMSSDPDGEYFADGLSEEILNWLANVEGLRVPGRTTSFKYKNQAEDMRVIGERLNVGYLLEGSVREAGGNLRVTAQLIDVETGYHLWSETYDRTLDDVFAIQEDIAETVTRELLGALPNGGIINPAETGEVDARAHKLYLEGRTLWNRRDQATSAKKLYEATETDPNHAMAHAYLSIALTLNLAKDFRNDLGVENLEGLRDASLATAVALKPSAADVLFAQGWAAEMGEGLITEEEQRQRNEIALGFYEKAIKAYPRHVEALYALARHTLQFNAPCSEVITLMQQVIDIDPAYLNARSSILQCYRQLGEYEKHKVFLDETILLSGDVQLDFLISQARLAGNMEQAAKIAFQNWNEVTSEGRPNKARIALLADLGAIEEALLLSRYQDFSRNGLGRSIWHRQNRTMLAGDLKGQLAVTREALSLPQFLVYWGELHASTLIKDGDPEKALEIMSKVLPDLENYLKVPKYDRIVGVGDANLYCVALALEDLGRAEEARQLWNVALAGEAEFPEDSWRKALNLTIINAHLGNRDEALRQFTRAYDRGFRFIWSYDCTICIDDDLATTWGYFGPLKDDPEFLAILEQIKSENAKILARLDRQFGFLGKIRALDQNARNGSE